MKTVRVAAFCLGLLFGLACLHVLLVFTYLSPVLSSVLFSSVLVLLVVAFLSVLITLPLGNEHNKVLSSHGGVGGRSIAVT